MANRSQSISVPNLAIGGLIAYVNTGNEFALPRANPE
jgi:hypothetical protein|eukprot:CAMPEP_0174316256 /NCGR_PEP_ID=MMETSP0810-20121108/6806_1 /TAXON_ID=73025 ORGANISM="Eutreptiella gymnastica-like, Strain CCMP1594" /NCGR_SAMPLE_ID=MMETSP0810 /ASSEMBLY_ACC=CAM_ASM_000659 /LENGTH=36 /DNA_ID= /DNA_START= /DNA_END= /DNA_ORIENTATION=